MTYRITAHFPFAPPAVYENVSEANVAYTVGTIMNTGLMPLGIQIERTS